LQKEEKRVANDIHVETSTARPSKVSQRGCGKKSRGGEVRGREHAVPKEKEFLKENFLEGQREGN